MLGVLRVRSSGWWGLVLCLSLAVGAYIVFDVLDVDGSDLHNRILHNPIAPPTLSAEAERSVHEGVLPPDPRARMEAPRLVERLFAPLNASARAAPESLRSRLRGIYPRVHAVSLDSLSTSSPTDDLASIPARRI